MALLGFKKEMAPAVEAGWKRQTIRWTRKDIYLGKALQLSTGVRTKAYRKLWPVDPACTLKVPIIIYDGHVILDGLRLPYAATESFARADGFDNAATFFNFFRKEYELPFGNDERGAEVIYW